MIFRYYIIGGDGNTYEQQVEVDDRAGRSFTQLEADAQRQINNQLAESGATQLTLPDTNRGTNNYVPEVQRNFDPRTGTSNVGGRTINLSNPNAPTITQGCTSPLLPSGANIPPAVQPRITMTSSGNTGSTFYGDAGPVNYGAATPGFANSAGQTSAGNVPFDINNQLMMQGATQGPAPSPFAFNPEFSAPGTIDTRTPVREFEGDVMEGGGGPIFAPPSTTLEPEPEIETDINALPSELTRINEQSVVGLSGADFDTVFRRLIEEKTASDGSLYRLYSYGLSEGQLNAGGIETIAFLVEGGKENDYTQPFNNEVAVSPQTYERSPNILQLTPNDLLGYGTSAEYFNNGGNRTDTIALNVYSRENYKDQEKIPDWYKKVNELNNREVFENRTNDGNIIYSFGQGLSSEQLAGADFMQPGTGNIGTGTGIVAGTEEEEVSGPQVGDFDTSVSSPGGPGSGAAPSVSSGPGQTANQVRIEDVSGEFLDFDITDALSNFLASSPSLGVNLPVDAEGNRRNITPDDFPGFPAEILDPNNLFIRVTEDRRELSDPSLPFNAQTNPYVTETITRVVPNPAVELLLTQYAERVRGLTDLQGSADDILQAQVSASGGLFGGPTGSLTINQLEDLERETRSIQASGGRLVQERVFDAEGEPTGQFREVLTPLGEEERLSRQQRLAEEAVRQSGGLLGGFFTPLTDPATGLPLTGEDAGQRFVQGFTPQQLLQRQEEELRRGRQQELEVLERQRERDLELARINQAPQTFRNIADLYSNPAQLAAIVASGGSPLLRGQLPGSVPLPQTAMQTGAMTPQQTSATPFMITNPSGTIFDPNLGGTSIEGDLRRQEANPFNVRDFSGITEDRLNRLTEIELARAQGEAAAQGIAPDQLQDIALGNTPGQAGSPLQGYLAPSTLFR